MSISCAMKTVRFFVRRTRLIVFVGLAFLASFPATAEDPTPEVLERKVLKPILEGAAPKTVDQLLALQKRIQELTPKLIERTVAVQVGRANGSGVIVSSDGYVLTAAHVAGTPNQSALVFLANGKQVTGTTLGLNEVLDAGLIKLSGPGPWNFAKLGDSSKIKRGQWCLGTGHPGGYDPKRQPILRMGRIIETKPSAILSDCPLIGGDSGGPLFDVNGDVIGIHSRIGKNLTVNVHVPVDRYRSAWDRLAKGEAWDLLAPRGRSWIGVRQDASAVDAVRVKSVVVDSPAEAAGIKPGDEIIRFGSVSIKSFDTLKRQVLLYAPGEEVTMTVNRKGRLRTITLRIGALAERETQK